MAKRPSSSKTPRSSKVADVAIMLDSCQTIGFNVTPPNVDPNGKSISFTTAIEHTGDPDNGKIVLGVRINGLLESGDGEEETVISILTMTIFTIGNAAKLKRD